MDQKIFYGAATKSNIMKNYLQRTSQIREILKINTILFLIFI